MVAESTYTDERCIYEAMGPTMKDCEKVITEPNCDYQESCIVKSAAEASRRQGNTPLLPQNSLNSASRSGLHTPTGSKKEDELEEQLTSQDVEDQDGKLIMDLMKKEDKKTDCLEESEQDTEECSSGMHAENETQGKKEHGWRKKRQQKMDHGKQWIMDCLCLAATTVSVVSLSDVEETYRMACLKDDREPLTSNVLARLIHEQFPEVGKYRQGSRGNQKIHYRNLQWRISSSPQEVHIKEATTTVSENETSDGMPSDSVTPAEVHDEGKKPVLDVKHRDNVQDSLPEMNTEEMLHAVKEAVVRAALHPSPEDEDKDEVGCEDAANRLAQVVKWLKSEGKWDLLLKTFAHSASCNSSPCSSLCLMFRRVRRHVVSARHACHVLRIYSVLLKLHVGSCNNNECGMTACPALRASRQMKRGRDDELLERENHQLPQRGEFQHINKKLYLQRKHPLSLKMRPASPASSLPDSQPSTPTPPTSPSHTFSPSLIRIPPLSPVNMAHIPSERGGA